MLQPTSPLRHPEQVRACLAMLIEGGWDAVWTVSRTDPKNHPLKQLRLGDAGELDYYDPEAASIIARQQLSPIYHRNGVAYALTRECLAEQRSLKGRRAGALVLDGPHVSIDTLSDLALVEWIATRAEAGGS
jgi:CMP-N-acetylneuraminic acid synthetase